MIPHFQLSSVPSLLLSQTQRQKLFLIWDGSLTSSSLLLGPCSHHTGANCERASELWPGSAFEYKDPCCCKCNEARDIWWTLLSLDSSLLNTQRNVSCSCAPSQYLSCDRVRRKIRLLLIFERATDQVSYHGRSVRDILWMFTGEHHYLKFSLKKKELCLRVALCRYHSMFISLKLCNTIFVRHNIGLYIKLYFATVGTLENKWSHQDYLCIC